MAIKTIKYKVDINGIAPATEQFAGTQGDHRVTKLEFVLSDNLCDDIRHATTDKVMFRFDIYDGEGGVWRSNPQELDGNVLDIELEERHTRYGGKIAVYLVLTALSSKNETETELYSFPAVLRLKNRPNGASRDGENYESVAGLFEITKLKAAEAASHAWEAENSNQEVQSFVTEIEEKLQNGEFDGLGVKKAEIKNGELIITYTDNTSQNLGTVKGDKGESGNTLSKGVVEAVADTIPLRDGKCSLNVGLTVANVANGLPIPLCKLDNGKNNVVCWDGTVATSFSSRATGKEDDPIIISTAEELAYLIKNANKNMTVFTEVDDGESPLYKPKYFKIADGIDAIVLQKEIYADEIMALSSSDEVYDYFTDTEKTFFQWVGTGWEKTMFGGHFDGNGATIYGMYFNSDKAINNGLFSTIDAGAVIENVIIKNSYMKSTSENYNTGTIAAASSSTSYGLKIGGVIAVNNCAVINCYLRNSTSDYTRCGVLLGNMQDTAYVENCLVCGNDAFYADEIAMPLVGSASTSVVSTVTAPTKINPKLYFESDNNRYLHYNMIRNSIVLGTTPYNAVCYALRKNDAECFENVFTDAPTGTVKFGNSSTVTYSDEQIMHIECKDIIGRDALKIMPQLAWGSEWFVPMSFKGKSAPINFVQSTQKLVYKKIEEEILKRSNADENEASARKIVDDELRTLISGKSITSVHTSQKYTFDWNAVYLIKSNSGNVDITLCNTLTDSVVIDGDGNDLPDSSLCFLILPKSTAGLSGRLCMFVGMTGKFSVVNSNVVQALQFSVANGNVCFTPKTSASIFKIAL